MYEKLLLLISIPLYAIVIGVEMIMSHLQVRKFYTLKETLFSAYLCIANASIDLLFRVVYLGILGWFFTFHFVKWDAHPYLYWVLLLVAEDFIFYIEHTVDHYSRLFWAVHVTHHSSEEFNLTTGFRSSVFQPLYRFLYFIPLVLFGFKPLDIIFMYSLTQIYGILVHTQYINKMPAWFEMFFVSPSHHRVHHASNIRYLDKNMGMCLIIWDKLFGTFQEEVEQDPVVYGLTKPLQNPHHPVHIIFHEWKDLFRDLRSKSGLLLKLKYLFMPPGWSHDGSTKTANELRRELEMEENKHSSFGLNLHAPSSGSPIAEVGVLHP
jgi:sterol desaturase/sphingolipid hydroxylase (fatty acid hydroxylase superfamily)